MGLWDDAAADAVVDADGAAEPSDPDDLGELEALIAD